MKKITIVSGIMTFYSLFVSALIFVFERAYYRRHLETAILTKNEIMFLLSFIIFVYFLMLFIKIRKDEEFQKKYKITLRLFIWPSLVALAIPILVIILSIWTFMTKGYHNETLGFALMIITFFSFYGMVITSILSLVGFAIDSILNKRK